MSKVCVWCSLYSLSLLTDYTDSDWLFTSNELLHEKRNRSDEIKQTMGTHHIHIVYKEYFQM